MLGVMKWSGFVVRFSWFSSSSSSFAERFWFGLCVPRRLLIPPRSLGVEFLASHTCFFLDLSVRALLLGITTRGLRMGSLK